MSQCIAQEASSSKRASSERIDIAFDDMTLENTRCTAFENQTN